MNQLLATKYKERNNTKTQMIEWHSLTFQMQTIRSMHNHNYLRKYNFSAFFSHRSPSTIQNHTSKCDFQSLLVLVPVQPFDRLETRCIGCFASNRDHTICVAIQWPISISIVWRAPKKLRRRNKSVVPPSLFQHFNVGKTNRDVPHKHLCAQRIHMQKAQFMSHTKYSSSHLCVRFGNDNDRETFI